MSWIMNSIPMHCHHHHHVRTDKVFLAMIIMTIFIRHDVSESHRCHHHHVDPSKVLLMFMIIVINVIMIILMSIIPLAAIIITLIQE